ncbi:MAG: glutamine-hydrolyzing GMP synthase [Deltaproteobacteria bacterium]|nr:glutamine-hydrolyzing GMP synthase [Deltaproteobacteria bacterium]MBW2053305.1 glutamine-hydrolyzing GMP synthase [Deltaproteobacteria bacterium]MBW2139695.1 glutamine-hydrolyzing GMP synthase [Deltaproteobacteria bacterium]MBW2321966.1 glutamine-hydrolyzing GMP synthase [Deltaproteobacteria bacterium]
MGEDIHKNKIIILDFGSQYTQLIARRVRGLKVYSEIHPCTLSMDQLRSMSPGGIILSGGPSSVNLPDAPMIAREVFEMGAPVLGICYGMQLMTHILGGEVAPSGQREYGPAELIIDEDTGIFSGLKNDEGILDVWMSHGDRIEKLPAGFKSIAHSQNSPVAAMRDNEGRLIGVQFHPEVYHTPKGQDIIANFLFRICELEPTWTMANFIESAVSAIQARVGDDRVICALSGGVDSSVVAALLHRAIADKFTAIFVDNGLLRKNEAQDVVNLFKERFQKNLIVIDAAETFLQKLKGVEDPEEKRIIIGHEFIRIFETEAEKLGDVNFLAQGTLYPDVIESISFKGPSATIKSHHNVGGLPETMDLELIEPLSELFKDEVRELGTVLGLPEEMVYRQPFPGPGLAVRILGEATPERIRVLQEADAVVREEIERNLELARSIWQYFAVLLPVKTVGVMGDERTYENVAGLRIVDSVDAMTADWTRLPYDILAVISNRIINEVKGINRVVLDVSSKPPSTIEWE